jgi:L-lactate dehydrogenase
MQIAVIGTGNVGSGLLMHLVDLPAIDGILVMDIKDEWSKAAIMDVGSAKPRQALKLIIAPISRLGESDIIVLTAGVQWKEGETDEEVLVRNAKVMNTILDTTRIKKSAILIALAVPVDDITVHIQRRYNLPHNQILGFGGDLDYNRLVYVLSRRNISFKGADVVGEHGKNIIPVYGGEENYFEVAKDMRGFVAEVLKAMDRKPRNHAAAYLLAKLVETIVTNSKRIHYVCNYHPEHNVYLTWPFRIGRDGVLEPEPVTLFRHSEEDLNRLIQERRSKSKNS